MRCLLVHPITGGRNFYDIPWFGSPGMWLPKTMAAIVTFPILTGLSLWMFGVFQGMIPIRNPHIVNIKRKLPAFPKMQDAFV
jgi:hypothetical protein